MKNNLQKKTYQTPKLNVIGKIPAMTLSSSAMGTSDGASTGQMNS